MTCERMQEILDAYLDGETPAPDAREIEEHLQECAACAGALASRKALQTALRTKLAYYRAPADVRARAATPHAGPDAGAPVADLRANVPAGYSARSTAWWRRAAVSMAACFALVSFALIGLLAAPAKSSGPSVAQLVLSDHLRSLEGVSIATAEPIIQPSPHLVDVLSSDKHTVKPWFAGKLPFTPPVPLLDDFPLIGGRLDRVLDQPAAALVYRRDKHIINLFVWPAATETHTAPVAHAAAGGYHEVEFGVPGFTCWAASDVEMDELLNFARAYQQGVAAAPAAATKP